jgi:hypothetical protein
VSTLLGPVALAEVQDLSLKRFAQLLAMGIFGLAGLLSLGVGGVALVQGHAFPAPGIGVREPGARTVTAPDGPSESKQ